MDGTASLARGEQLCPSGVAVVALSHALEVTLCDGAREQPSTALRRIGGALPNLESACV